MFAPGWRMKAQKVQRACDSKLPWWLQDGGSFCVPQCWFYEIVAAFQCWVQYGRWFYVPPYWFQDFGCFMYLHVECVSRWLLLFTSMLSPCHGGCFFLPQFWFNEMHGCYFYVPPCWFHEMVAASMYSMLIPWHRVCYCASMLIQWDAWWRLLCTSMLIPWDGESFCVPPCWIHCTVDAWWPLW